MKTRRDLLKLAAAGSVAAACKAAPAQPAPDAHVAAAPWPDEAKLLKNNADARAALAKVALRNEDAPDLLPQPRPAGQR
jgi:hypothetical protein